ncbi:MAG: alpha/beta fold hydrolase [Actinobacteria bacterium]|nr:alpha/beta fold hydrolase [Actinomycetota bacterium]MCB8997381.1 alpha/beta fold hydrolase [Actinomycetota bacterium]MCB9414169.1 alpha/beta fold hydrolase [Actinomycetota bacterium]MCB9423688.1 alpha/beta fold hydrolase [Actinomycetota bacterium]HRY08833.1 alpha/beta fold hydrolase [Candidatus Nanopelagicales bacterium]
MPPPEASLVFLPGFMSSAKSYTALLAPLVDAGVAVEVPQLYPRGLGALRGKHSVRQEAADAATLVRELSGPVFLAGHSRGGQAAWLAAGELPGLSGLFLLDPVDGQGRKPQRDLSTRVSSAYQGPVWIAAAGVSGPCAPVGANHEQFARATPQSVHIVVEDLGHADMLQGRARTLGRRLCGGGTDPDAARGVCTGLLADFMAGDVPDVGEHPGFRRVR